MNFDDLRTEVRRRFVSRQFAEALALIDRERQRFLAESQRIGNWLAMIFCAMGQPARAVAAMQEVVDRGGWYSERALGTLGGGEALETAPGYAELLSVCRRRHAEALAAAKPQLLTRLAAASPAPAILALHGNMSNAAVAAETWAPAVAQGCFVGLCQSTEIEAPDMYVWEDWNRAEQEIRAHHAALLAHPAVDPERTVLGGFSMGGGLAAFLSLKGAVPVRGFIVIGPYIPDMEAFRAAVAGARGRGYILVGDADEVCLPHARALFELLQGNGVPVEMEVVPELGHAFPDDFPERLQQALAFVLG